MQVTSFYYHVSASLRSALLMRLFSTQLEQCVPHIVLQEGYEKYS